MEENKSLYSWLEASFMEIEERCKAGKTFRQEYSIFRPNRRYNDAYKDDCTSSVTWNEKKLKVIRFDYLVKWFCYFMKNSDLTIEILVFSVRVEVAL